jgi:hypothetical protein
MGCSQRARCVEIKVGKVHAILAGLACLQSRTEGGNVTSGKSPSNFALFNGIFDPSRSAFASSNFGLDSY